MEPTRFIESVKATAARHPQLRSVIDQATSSYQELDGFVAGEDHYEVIQTGEPDDWKVIADRESNAAADMYGPKPLWKVFLVKYHDTNVLLVKFHHCIGDGSSGYIITNDILRFYQRLTDTGEIGDVEALPRLASPQGLAFQDGVVPDGEQSALGSLVEDLTRRRCEWRPRLAFDRTVGGGHNTTLYLDGTEENAVKLLA